MTHELHPSSIRDPPTATLENMATLAATLATLAATLATLAAAAVAVSSVALAVSVMWVVAARAGRGGVVSGSF